MNIRTGLFGLNALKGKVAVTSIQKLAQFSDTVETIYDAALQPEKWPLVAEKVAHLHESDKSVLFSIQRSEMEPRFAFPAGIDEASMDLWQRKYARDDLWTLRTFERGLVIEGKVITNEDLATDREFKESRFYTEFLRELDISKVISGIVFSGADSALPSSACSVYRGEKAPAFDSSSRQLHQLTTAHLSNAMGTMLRLRDTELQLASTLGALNRLPTAVILLSADCLVQFANQAAERMLAASQGVSLRASGLGGLGRLRLAQENDQARLDKLLSLMSSDQRAGRTGHFCEAIRVGKARGRGEYLLRAVPLGRNNEYSHMGAEIRVMVFVSEDRPARAPLDHALLKKTYGLTPAEIKVAEEILLAERTEDIALALGLSITTVRTHLRSMYDKTGAQRQGQLIKTLLAFRLMEQ